MNTPNEAAPKVAVHIKNNRAGEEIFRITPERYAAAAARHPDVAGRLSVTLDWDLDRFNDSMAEAVALMTWDHRKRTPLLS